MDDTFDLAASAPEQGASPALRSLLSELGAQAGAGWFYVFWVAGHGGGAGTGRSGKPRLLLAFRTPDSALAFAQRNRLTGDDRPRLRRLALAQLVEAVLREPAITALLLAEEIDDGAAPAGHLPHGLRIERAELLRRLTSPTPEP
jgi:hypothetical protein